MSDSFRMGESMSSEREGPILASASYFNGNYSTRLNAEYIDVSEDDQSCCAKMTRGIAAGVSAVFHPKQIIVAFRLLKAMTFCCLALSITAELLYIFAVELAVSADVGKKLGGLRDIIIRIYGLGLAVIAVLIELDMKVADRNFAFLKAFIPRSLLLFFAASISSTAPVIGYENRLYPKRKNKNYDDDYYDYNANNVLISSEVPGSAVAFQSTTSFFLFLCAITYFVFGLFCLDRFTSKAFLSNSDPVSSTAISNGNRGYDDNEYDEYDEEYDHHDVANNRLHSYSEDETDSRL